MESIINGFTSTFINENRYELILKGFGNTICISLVATVIGVFIGLIISIIQYMQTTNRYLKPLSWFCNIYLVIIRGTPVVVQLMILYFSIFSNVKNAIPIAMLTFGINSGAYVSEIMRAGLQSIPKGQSEAGRSLGIIIIPQAIKNIIPALFNEFITLVKETSVAGYVAIPDLTKVMNGIYSRTYDASSLYFLAAIYLLVVVGLTLIQKYIERRFARSDTH
ncbi:MAG: amino acid ABC transporter permease [Oscillospiraceae bacterium]